MYFWRKMIYVILKCYVFWRNIGYVFWKENLSIYFWRKILHVLLKEHCFCDYEGKFILSSWRCIFEGKSFMCFKGKIFYFGGKIAFLNFEAKWFMYFLGKLPLYFWRKFAHMYFWGRFCMYFWSKLYWCLSKNFCL